MRSAFWNSFKAAEGVNHYIEHRVILDRKEIHCRGRVEEMKGMRDSNQTAFGKH